MKNEQKQLENLENSKDNTAIIPKKKLDIEKLQINSYLKKLKQNGFYVPSLKDVRKIRQLKWLYYYFTNGFNSRDAYYAAGYKAVKSSVRNSIFILKQKLAPQIVDLIDLFESTDSIQTVVKTGMMGLAQTDLADYEDFMNGTCTLQELRDRGVDTSAIKSVIIGTDRDGNPYGKVELDSKASVLEKLNNIYKKAGDDVNKSINIAKQTIIVNSHVPSARDRIKNQKQLKKETKEEDIIDVQYDDITGQD